jgi:predicted transposase/invertase (TIGR01784 family)
MDTKNTIRFDWAIKRLLRNKANYKVLEGFLSELLREDVTIVNISESEGNQDSISNKFNRLDILVENANKELIIIELQNKSEVDYFSRMVYGVSRVITNYMWLGDKYEKVRKVFSINIVYFEIGQSRDYVYHGKNEFRGIHENDLLKLSDNQQEYFDRKEVSSLFPEYYIIKVNGFNDIAKDTLDEWIYYLKNDEILDGFKAKGLAEAREILRVDRLSEKDRAAYFRHVENSIYEESVLSSAIKKERIERNHEIVIVGYQNGLSMDIIQTLTGYNHSKIEQILKEQGIK